MQSLHLIMFYILSLVPQIHQVQHSLLVGSSHLSLSTLLYLGGAAGGGYAQVIPMEEVKHTHSNFSLAGNKKGFKSLKRIKIISSRQYFAINSLAPLCHGTKVSLHKGAVIDGSVKRIATWNESRPFVLLFSSTSTWLGTFTLLQQPITCSQQLLTPVFSMSPRSQTRCLLLTLLNITHLKQINIISLFCAQNVKLKR